MSSSAARCSGRLPSRSSCDLSSHAPSCSIAARTCGATPPMPAASGSTSRYSGWLFDISTRTRIPHPAASIHHLHVLRLQRFAQAMQQIVVQRHLPGLAEAQLAAGVIVAVVDLHRALAVAIRDEQSLELRDTDLAVAAQYQLLREVGTRRGEVEQLLAAHAHIARILVQRGLAAHHQQLVLAYPRLAALVFLVEHGHLDLRAAVV